MAIGRTFVAATFAALSLGAAASPTGLWIVNVPVAGESIRLDSAADFAALRASNPGHYARALAVIDAAGKSDCQSLDRLLPAQLEVEQVRCSAALIMTSYPARRALTFVLDDIAYGTHVVISRGERAVPLAPARNATTP